MVMMTVAAAAAWVVARVQVLEAVPGPPQVLEQRRAQPRAPDPEDPNLIPPVRSQPRARVRRAELPPKQRPPKWLQTLAEVQLLPQGLQKVRTARELRVVQRRCWPGTAALP